MRRIVMGCVVLALAGCDSDSVKEGFLSDLPDVADGAETSDGASSDGIGDTGTSDATVVNDVTTTETTTEVVDSDSGLADVSDIADSIATDTGADVSNDTLGDVPVASDVVIPAEALEGLGWHAVIPQSASVGAAFVYSGGVALPFVNGTAVELRAWDIDGAGRFAATVLTGTAPRISGGVACDDSLYVAANESDSQKAVVTRIGANGSGLVQVSFFPKVGTLGSTSVDQPRCGGPGSYIKLEPVGAVTYKTNEGGTVQLTAEQTLNRSFLIDLTKAFSSVGTLGTVSADKIAILGPVVAEPLVGAVGKKVFYVGEARVPKQLGAVTLQPGDQLVYARDYVADVGGTATNTAFYGDNDIRLLAAASDGRFAVAWRAVLAPPASVAEEQRVSTFDADGALIGTAIVSANAPLTRMRWEGDDLILGGSFIGAAPVSGDNYASGTWLAVMHVGVSMTVTRSATFGVESRLMGPLHRVTMGGTCSGDAWAVAVASPGAPGSLRVVALGDDGSDCTSASFGLTLGADDTLTIVPANSVGDYYVSTSDAAGLTLDGGARWPNDAPAAFVGRIRARVGAPSHP